MIVAIEPLNRTDGSGARKSNTGGSRTMPMDAYRDGNQLIIQFDISGIDPDSLEINVENNTLTVRARRPRPQIEESRWLVSERLHGTFTAQLELGDAVALDNIQADYDGGVLTIRIPIAEEAKARRIEIGGGRTSGAEPVAS